MNTKAKGAKNEHRSMRLFAAPPNAKKVIHRYRDYVRLPDVKTL